MISSGEVFGLLKKFLVKDITDLENLVDGEKVFLEDYSKEEENIFGYAVDLKVERIILRDLPENLNAKYELYHCRYNNHLEEGFLQRLNYEDFLDYNNHFEGVVESILENYITKIIQSTTEYLKINLDSHLLIKTFVQTVLNDVKRSIEQLRRSFNKDGVYTLYHYSGTTSDPKITSVMKVVLEYQNLLLDMMLKELDVNFPFLETNSCLQEQSYPRAKKKLIWYKLALLIATGKLDYQNDTYIFNTEKFSSALKAAELLEDEIQEKKSTIRIYLTETFYNYSSTTDKNIFILSRLNELDNIKRTLGDQTLSPTFIEKVEQLKLY